jgi:hypothetical protein
MKLFRIGFNDKERLHELLGEFNLLNATDLKLEYMIYDEVTFAAISTTAANEMIFEFGKFMGPVFMKNMTEGNTSI